MLKEFASGNGMEKELSRGRMEKGGVWGKAGESCDSACRQPTLSPSNAERRRSLKSR